MRSATRKRTGKDPEYLDFLRKCQCIFVPHQCASGLWPDRWPVEAAHVGVRGLSQKCPDREAIPLCPYHHRIGRDSHHTLGKRFWEHHGLNREELIAKYNRLFEERV